MILGVVLMPHVASADWMSDLSCIFDPAKCVEKAGLNLLSNLAASIGNLVLMVSSWFLSLAGIVLNISIILTMNIKVIYQSTPAIGEVWIVIRNISSMFIIFGLIFTSIQTILDVGKPNVKGLIINIIIAGLLINFSLFFTKTLIDASNLVSLQFYRAISPDSKNVNLATGDLSTIVSSGWSGVGLSNIFMQSLKIPSVYSTPKGFLGSDGETNFTRIFISTIAGSALMIFAALSFFAAAIAFIIRVVLLLLLMAFSPVYFIGMMFPQIKTSVSAKWEDLLIGQLLFMPAYLLLMYVAMKFIAGPGFFAALDIARTSSATGPAGILLSTVGLLLQFTIAFILINAPLVVAIKLGGKSTEWGNNAKKWASDRLKSVSGSAWHNTGGRAASKISENESFKTFASKSIAGEWALRGARGVATNYNVKLDKQVARKTQFANSLGFDKNEMNVEQAKLRDLNYKLAEAQTKKASKDAIKDIKDAIGKTKGSITNLENRRSGAFAARTNLPTIETLYSKIARKDKVAASKLQIPIIQDQVDRYKEDLKSTKADMKQLQQAIVNNPKDTGNEVIPGVNGKATVAQKESYEDLLADQLKHTNKINEQEALIDKLKLIS